MAFPLTVAPGKLEVNILTDGSLDYPDEILDIFDCTVVSVHQNFTLSEKDQTTHIVKAAQNPHATILGHLTGRLVPRRPGYALDQAAVIEACAETGTVVEINASSHRLDMDWRWVVKAKERGCTFSINPDAHHTSGFDDVYYGVLMAHARPDSARRTWQHRAERRCFFGTPQTEVRQYLAMLPPQFVNRGFTHDVWMRLQRLDVEAYKEIDLRRSSEARQSLDRFIQLFYYLIHQVVL